MRSRQRRSFLSIPEKANRILNGILIVLILITVRLWQLAIIQHDEKLEAAQKPQRRVVVERSERATIRDRFDVLLATNKVQYNAAITYGDIREIPRVAWEKDENGKKKKRWRRKEYIKSLSFRLAEELDLEAERIEDLIHAKAAGFGNLPLVIKENLTEKEYFRLKMLERQWPGIRAELVATRNYPLGPIAGDVIGYLGAISPKEYEASHLEMRALREFVARYESGEMDEFPDGYTSIEQVEHRLKDLEGKAYSINDYIGKMGIEGKFDENLRGRRGKRYYLSDIRGNFLRELPGSELPVPGESLYLSISSELQEYAERLLTESEQMVPSPRMLKLQKDGVVPLLQPWMKGGAVVVMDPQNGEILALASYPRFNPNDFIRSGKSEENIGKKAHIKRWLENEGYLEDVWNGKQPLIRERFDTAKGEFDEEHKPLTWQCYLNLILPSSSPVRKTLEKKGTVKEAIHLQQTFEELLSFFKGSIEPIAPLKILDWVYQGEDDVPTGAVFSLVEKDFLQKTSFQRYTDICVIKDTLKTYFDLLSLNYDKLLLLDLMRLVVSPSNTSAAILKKIADFKLDEFREASSHFVIVKEVVKAKVKKMYHCMDFAQWRSEHFKEYLAKKRKEEEVQKRKYGRPYIDYLDELEEEMFETFWSNYQWNFLTFFLAEFPQKPVLAQSPIKAYLEQLLNWKEEVFSYQQEKWIDHAKNLSAIFSTIEPNSLGPVLTCLRTFEDLHHPLYGDYPGVRRDKGIQFEKHLASAFYPINGYGYVRSQAYRQSATIGSIFKLIPAYESLRQLYLSFPASQRDTKDLNPLVIVDDKHRIGGKGGGWFVGFTAEGKPIPLYYHGGRLTRSEHTAVGRVDLVKAIEASSNPYFSLLAGEFMEDPEDLCRAARDFGYGEKTGIDLPGEIPGRIPEDVSYNRSGLYSMAIGQHSMIGTPLQTAVMLSSLVNGGKILRPHILHGTNTIEGEEQFKPDIKRILFLPPPIRQILIKGMRQVVTGEKGTARSLKKHFSPELVDHLIGKTSTAEVNERISLAGSTGVLKCKHIWFGAISFDPSIPEDFARPDLVVIVYLRYGEFGKEAAPLAAKIIKKWREIQKEHR